MPTKRASPKKAAEKASAPDASGPDKRTEEKPKKGEASGAPVQLHKPEPAKAGLKAGQEAPQFEALDEKGMRYSLNAYRGKTVVLYFYPKDGTPGCTQEACDFRDSFNALGQKGAVLFAVSGGSAQSHVNFSEKNRLPFPLFLDEDFAVCKAYGVYGEKSLYGRKFEGIIRSTFLIGKDGKIARIWSPVKVAGHASQVLEAV